MEAEEVFHGDKVRGLDENQLSYSGFVGSRKVLLKSILLYSFVVQAETSHQYRSF
jgi:hypothetical protein